MSLIERVLWVLAGLLVFSFLYIAMPKAQEAVYASECASQPRLQETIKKRYKPVFSAAGKTNSGDYVSMGIRADGRWYLLLYKREGGACVIFEGTQWLLVGPVLQE